MASKRKDHLETRFERWLHDLAEALEGEGWQTRLGYDDRHRGERLWLTMTPPGLRPQLAHLELQVERKAAKSAVLRLFADTLANLSLLAEVLQGQHRKIRRIDNAKRKFVHRVARMAAHLSETFEQRRGGYPRALLERLQQLVPGASAEIGLEGSYRARRALFKAQPSEEDQDDDFDLARGSRRYRPAFAAGVPLATHRRSAPHRGRGGFEFRGEALQLVQLQLVSASADPALLPIANRDELELASPPREHDSSLDMVGEAVDVGTCAVDCDWFDLPDCDVCDVPDCG